MSRGKIQEQHIKNDIDRVSSQDWQVKSEELRVTQLPQRSAMLKLSFYPLLPSVVHLYKSIGLVGWDPYRMILVLV